MKTLTLPDGREFRFGNTRPYTRRDGTASHLDVWSAECARPDCTARFTVSVPAGATPASTKAFGAKHCADHKLSRSECMALVMAARKKLRAST